MYTYTWSCYCTLSTQLCTLNPETHHLHSISVPGQPSVSVGTTTATSISLSWSVPSGSVVTSYEVMWTSDECLNDVHEDSATTTETSYIIENLRGGTRHTITVSATNSVGTALSDAVTGETEELGN